MNRARYKRVRDVFHAVAATTPDARAALLEEACNGDDQLRGEVESLLRQVDTPDVDLEGAADAIKDIMSDGPPPALELDWIGDYRVARILGEGGMGVVYLAQQERPRRTVAVKLLRGGAQRERNRRRFEREMELLGRLRHPGIAQIYDAGSTDAGPYFAMEYVDGLSPIEYADTLDLDVRGRMALLVKICEAVEHAHRRDVVHRDLKPSNILVDETGQPKILDFGVARSLGAQRLTTLRTTVGQLVGTVPYMAPEQVTGHTEDIDHRCDVYALGVLAYELLSGRLPFDLGSTLPEVVRAVECDDPTPLGTIDRVFRGDLETIVGTALAKEPERRYPSAAAFAADLQRWASDEPITARPPSTMYQLRKFTRRNRALVAGVVAAFGALMIGMTATSLALIEAQDQRDEARAAQDAADEAAHEAETARAAAARERDEATRVRDVLRMHGDVLGELLDLADVDVERMSDATVRKILALVGTDISQAGETRVDAVLDLATRRARSSEGVDPQDELAMRAVVGQAWAARGMPHLAADHLRRAVTLHRALDAAPDESAYELFRVCRDVCDAIGDGVFSHDVAQELVVVGQHLMAETEPELAAAMHAMNLSLPDSMFWAFDEDRANARLQEVLELVEPLDPASAPVRIVADMLETWGVYTAGRDRGEVGRAWLAKAIEFRRLSMAETSIRLSMSEEKMLTLLLDDELAVEAERMAREMIAFRVQVMDDDHWYLALLRARLGQSLLAQDRIDEAAALLEAWAPRVIEPGGNSSKLGLQILPSMIEVMVALGDEERADHYRLELARGVVGYVQHPRWQNVLPVFEGSWARVGELSHELRDAIDSGAGVREAFQAIEAYRVETLTDDHPISQVLADCYPKWAEHYLNKGGSWEETLQAYIDTERIGRADQTRSDYKRAHTLWWLAFHRIRTGEHRLAEAHAREAVRLSEHNNWAFHKIALWMLGDTLVAQGRLDDAEPVLRQAVDSLTERFQGNINTVESLMSLSGLLHMRDAAGEGRPHAIAYLESVERRLDDAPMRELDCAARLISLFPGYEPDVRDRALALAKMAAIERPTEAYFQETLGLALYRAGRSAQALLALDEASSLMRSPRPQIMAAQAMAAYDSGDRVDARTRLDALDDLIATGAYDHDRDAVRLHEEAHRVVTGAAPTP